MKRNIIKEAQQRLNKMTYQFNYLQGVYKNTKDEKYLITLRNLSSDITELINELESYKKLVTESK